MAPFEEVPPVIRIKRNWCVHRYDGTRHKVPHSPAGYKMAWSIAANWINFAEAKKAYLDGLNLTEGHKCRFEGIGYFVSMEPDAARDIYVVDLDDCITGEGIAEWAMLILKKLNSYSEISPSGKGIHVFVKGKLPEGSKNTNDKMKDKNRIEVFVNKHHVTVTGNRLQDFPTTIEDRSGEIEEIYKEVMEVKKSRKDKERASKIKKSRVIYDGKAEAEKKYVEAAIEKELDILKGTPEGDRNNQLNRSAFAIGQFVGAHKISRMEAERKLHHAALFAGMDETKDGVEATIASGLDDGESNPRDIPSMEESPARGPKLPLPEISIVPDCKGMQVEVTDKDSISIQLHSLAKKNVHELWHTPEGTGYMTIQVNGHKEHYKIGSKRCRTWLARLGHDFTGEVISGNAIKDVAVLLEGEAVADGKEYEIHLRKAEHNGKIYVDLGDKSRKVVEIDQNGWRVINDCEVKFRRSKNNLELPFPEQGGEIDDLKAFINVPDDDSWILILAWLSQAFWCRGPFAHLYLRGSHGSTKSFMIRVLKSISDPSSAIDRRVPKSERDAAISLGSEAIPSYDNMSGIGNTISDLWCVASTGGVSTQRALFTDDEEATIHIKCAILANGIDDLTQRGDLLDRTIVVDLLPVAEENRRPEKEMWMEIESKRAQLFGALLDMTVIGLANIENVELDNPPRMADFAMWVCACLGEAGPAFMQAYRQSRENMTVDVAEQNRFPATVIFFVKTREERTWEGSPSMLLAELNNEAGIIPGKEPDDWPRSADKLGSEIRRYMPALKSKGISVGFPRTGRVRKIRLFGVTPSPSDTTSDTTKSLCSVTSVTLSLQKGINNVFLPNVNRKTTPVEANSLTGSEYRNTKGAPKNLIMANSSDTSDRVTPAPENMVSLVKRSDTRVTPNLPGLEPATVEAVLNEIDRRKGMGLSMAPFEIGIRLHNAGTKVKLDEIEKILKSQNNTSRSE